MTEFQWQCLVRQVLKWTATDTDKAVQFMNKVYDKSHERWQKLKRDCRQQYDKGNRGDWGDWK